MAGGSGERFWPLSTKERPKQLLPLISDKTMIRETVERLIGYVEFKDIFIATNELQYQNIMKELPEIPQDNIIVEPAFRDTAAAILYGSTYIATRNGEDSIIAVLASDHLITKREKFINSLVTANKIASIEDKIVTLGIKPTYPETGYGYIKVEDSKENIANANVTFIEKPNLEKANQYLASGKFLWNSGMFIFKYKTLLSNFTSYSLVHIEILRAIEGKISKLHLLDLTKAVKEQRISKVILGWNEARNFQTHIFSSVLDQFIKTCNEMIFIARIIGPLNITERVIYILPPLIE
jgi:mannose-1-phosphate guanylyltransferase